MYTVYSLEIAFKTTTTTAEKQQHTPIKKSESYLQSFIFTVVDTCSTKKTFSTNKSCFINTEISLIRKFSHERT